MRICHIITTLVYGGAERLLVNFGNLHARNHDIHILYLKGEPKLLPELDPSIKVHQVPLGKGIVPRLRAKVMEIGPDVVHTHLGHADFLGHVACVGLPVLRFCTMHNVWFKWTWKDHIIFWAYALLFATAARRCQVICISQCVADHVRNRLFVPPSRVHVVYNGIPAVTVTETRDQLRARLGIQNDRFVVLFVGRLRIQKSVDTLLEAVSAIGPRIPNLLVLLVGEGEEEERLRTMARSLGLDGVVEFRGTTAHPEHYFAAADIFVLPSIFEGLGLVVLEAFRAGIPVVATNIEGPKELITDGTTGLLFPPRHPEALGEALLRLHADPTLCERLGKAGLEGFKDRFTIEKYAICLERLYSEAAE
jgi:glycosyltransferase involved in cell wall biosynthesis